MVIIMVIGDFLAMSLTTDNVSPSVKPNAWRIGNLTIAGVILALCLLAFCTAVLAWISQTQAFIGGNRHTFRRSEGDFPRSGRCGGDLRR
jgi:hypothetical protein